MDALGLRAQLVSAGLHLALIALVLWKASPVPPPPEVPPPTLPEEAQGHIAFRPLLEREPAAVASAGSTDPGSPIDLDDIPPLSTGAGMPGRDHLERRDGPSQGSSEDGIGLELQAPTRIAALSGPTLADRYRDRATLSDEAIDLRLEEWARTAHQFQGLNFLRQRWQDAWRDRFGSRVERPRLALDLQVEADGSVHYLGIAPGGGTGLAELDEVVDAYLRSQPSSTIRPNRQLIGRIPITVHLE